MKWISFWLLSCIMICPSAPLLGMECSKEITTPTSKNVMSEDYDIVPEIVERLLNKSENIDEAITLFKNSAVISKIWYEALFNVNENGQLVGPKKRFVKQLLRLAFERNELNTLFKKTWFEKTFFKESDIQQFFDSLIEQYYRECENDSANAEALLQELLPLRHYLPSSTIKTLMRKFDEQLDGLAPCSYMGPLIAKKTLAFDPTFSHLHIKLLKKHPVCIFLASSALSLGVVSVLARLYILPYDMVWEAAIPLIVFIICFNHF